MPEYRRAWQPGGTFFFTVVTCERRLIFAEENAREILRNAFQYGMERVGSFRIDAICLLPDHLHCIWTLPENDSNYATRWKVIKARFSHQYLRQGGSSGKITPSKTEKGEVGVWQRRYWEHLLVDQNDLNRHIDYIHFNPVKHGLVRSVKDWQWSSFHRYVQAGFYDRDWGNGDSETLELTAGE